ncbi:MAG TPA: cytidylate kinase family protein [Thermoplasmata archaeon]|nr:cytidylate kinase family protein [Thermoplasmata archaeon]
MIRAVVTVGGPPGSGKSTAGRLVAQSLGLEFRSAGDLFRTEARRHGMDLTEFGRYAAAHPEVDRELDRSMQALATPGRLLDGRIQGPLCRRAGVPVYDIVVTAREDVRVQRVAGRDGQSIDQARRLVREREASERDRYQRFYGIDLAREPASLIVDSSDRSPDGVAEAILAFVREREAAAVR